MEELIILVKQSWLFATLFFSGILFGVVSQRIIDNQSIKPYLKRLAVAGMTVSITLTLNRMTFNIGEPLLYVASPLLGFFGEAFVEALNMSRKGVATGFIELLLERMGFVKKGGGKDEKLSQK